MPATGKITLDSSQYQAALERVKSETVKGSSQMSKAVSGFGQTVSKAGGAVSALSSEVSSSFGQIGKVIGSIASGPVAILTASLAALAAIGKTMWDKMTVSAGEYIAKLGKVIDQDKKHTEAVRSEQEEENAMMDRLQELITREHKSNEEKTEAVRLTALLVEKYPDLRKELNKTTGEFKNLSDAIEKVNELQKAEKISALQTQIENMTTKNQKLVESQYKGGMGNRFLDWANEKLGGTNVGQSQADYYSAQSVEDRLRLSKNALRDASTEDDIRFWSEQIDALEEIIKLQKQLDSLRETGFETTKQEAAALKEASEAEKAKREEAEKAEAAEMELQRKQYEAYQQMIQKQAEAEQKAREKEMEREKAWQNARRDAVRSLRDQALRASGQGQKADIEAAIREATQNKGSALTREERAQVIDMTKLKRDLNGISFSAPQDYTPRVNSLMARGGSEAPVKMPELETIQNKTLSTVEKIQAIVDRINSNIDDWLTT